MNSEEKMEPEATMLDVLVQFQKMEELMATKNDIDYLREEIKDKDDIMAKQDEAMRSLRNTILSMRQAQVHSKEHIRSLCLRIYNIEMEENETSEKCFAKIQKMIGDAGLDIPLHVVDRVYRVGEEHDDRPPAMIVKFTTWRHRRLLYMAKKRIKERCGYSLQVDLTKEKLHILKEVRAMGEEYKCKTGFQFAYANVDCVLFINTNGRFERFKSVEDARKVMGLSITEEDSVDEGCY